MKKLWYMIMVIFGSQISYGSDKNYPVAYTLLKISYDRVKSTLESYEQSLHGSETKLSDAIQKSLKGAMIYSSIDLVAYHDSLRSILDLQCSQRLTQTKKFKASGMSEEGYVEKMIQEFRANIISCEKQIKILQRLYSLS